MALRWDQIDTIRAKLAARLESHCETLHRLLTKHETSATAADELARSLRTLRGLHLESSYVQRVRLASLASFLPLNQPLYSLVLFGIVPAMMADAVAVRPSAETGQLVPQLWSILSTPPLAERLSVHQTTHGSFVAATARTTEAVIFTGSFPRAQQVMKALRPGASVVYNGSGVNPIVVMPDADLDRAASAIVTSATYNSGQDCAAPKCVFLHRDVAAKLAEKLISGLGALKLGDTLSDETDVGPVTRFRSVADFIDLVDNCRGEVKFGGQVDVVRRLIQPTLIIRRLESRFHYPEVYAPVINAAVFDHEQQVVDFTTSDRYQRNAMYVSTFGTFISSLPNTIVLQDTTVLEHEDGNRPFGGYGREASFVKVGGSRPVRGPVLVSAALAYAQDRIRP